MNPRASLSKKRKSAKEKEKDKRLKRAEGATKHLLKLHELAEEKVSLMQDHSEFIEKEILEKDDGAIAHFNQLTTMLADLRDILNDETWDEVDYLLNNK